MKALLAQMLAGKRDLALIALVIGVLIVLFVPIPSPLLDFLLVINISMALLILLVTFFTETPLKFSTFPTILLLVTLFRLSLNVSATRLILSGADAGRVINAIGEFVVGGNYIVGLVVFIILVVVQYVVVTSGAQRVAGVHERGAGHMQAHGLEQHLIAVGGAVKGAGAWRVVGDGLGLQQLGAAHQTLRRTFPDLALLAVGEPRRHRTGRHEHGG